MSDENKEKSISKGDIKEISSLLGMKFFIPSYQRGYRWSKQQVVDLLDDVWNFIASDPRKNEWYCLQPVVVKKNDEKKDTWEVIDGQQRLTTIFLILKYLEKNIDSSEKSFRLEYETRNTELCNSWEFLQNIETKKEKDSEKNIDYYHFYLAYQAVSEWFKKKAEQYKSVNSTMITPFLEKTKILWYEIKQKSQDSRDIFSRLNKGKIHLTNAELIKALFLNKTNFKTANALDEERIALKQNEIASEWDFIETTFHNDEFWLFINKDENDIETRIEFIYKLLVGDSPKTADKYYIFREYLKLFKENTESVISENWKDVKRTFQILQYWFEDRELYHKIGFLLTVGEDIKKLIPMSKKIEKTEFVNFIDDKITGLFSKVKIDEIEKGNPKVRQILLMHNIQTMLNNEEENSRFPFNRFKREKWDIEHVHAIATKIPEKEEHQKDWMLYAKEYLENLNVSKNKHEIGVLIDRLKNYDAGSFNELYAEIVKHIRDDEVNLLNNLVLLDSGTNRGYKNEFFSYKRKTIIEKDKTGTFIPICTKNVFMKLYSDKIGQMTFWDEPDREAYLENIKDVLKCYLPKGSKI